MMNLVVGTKYRFNRDSVDGHLKNGEIITIGALCSHQAVGKNGYLNNCDVFFLLGADREFYGKSAELEEGIRTGLLSPLKLNKPKLTIRDLLSDGDNDNV